MAKVTEVKCFLPEEIYKDFRWTVRVMRLSVRQAALEAIEDYIAKVKEKVAREAAENEAR